MSLRLSHRIRQWLNRNPLSAYGLLLAALIGVASGVLLANWSAGSSIDWPTVLSSASDLMTIVAIAIGGAWTLYVLRKRRSHEVRAEICHSWAVWKLSDKLLLRICVSLKNYGEVAVNPAHSYTLVQVPPRAVPNARKPSDETWRTIKRIRHRWAKDEVVVEPGETEAYTYDVEIAAGTQFVQLHTLVACQVDSDERWDETTLIDLQTPPGKKLGRGIVKPLAVSDIAGQ